MLSRTKWALSMYMPLITKMVENNPFFMVARVNFELFCDVNLLISLFCLMPMLEVVHALIKLHIKGMFLFVIMLQQSRFAKDSCILIIQILPRSIHLMFSRSSMIWLITFTTNCIWSWKEVPWTSTPRVLSTYDLILWVLLFGLQV